VARWGAFASLADQHGKRGLVVLFANPFSFSKATYPKVIELVEEQGYANKASLAFLHHAKHPMADRDGAEFTPGWNCSNAETTHLDHDGCYLLFGRDGSLLFSGRTTDAEITACIERALK
jgi:hypothetical protein